MSRLHEAGYLLSARCVSGLLGPWAERFEIVSLAECDSTNTRLLEAAMSGAPSGQVIVADRQTAARGSRQRTWQCSPQASLTFSLLWRFDGDLSRLSGLSLVVGLALIRALEPYGIVGLGVKWPNDVLYQGAKLAGILVELQTDTESGAAVIGIGMNLAKPEPFEATGLSLLPANLNDILGYVPERHRLLADLLIAFGEHLDLFTAHGFAALRDAWQSFHVWQDQPALLCQEQGGRIEGICRGVDADGALLFETALGLARYWSGEVSVRSLA